MSVSHPRRWMGATNAVKSEQGLVVVLWFAVCQLRYVSLTPPKVKAAAVNEPWHEDVNKRLLLACQAFKSAYFTRSDSTPEQIAESLSKVHKFSWQLIRKYGMRLLNNESYVPDIRGPRAIAQEPQPHAFLQHISEGRPGAAAGVSCCLL